MSTKINKRLLGTLGICMLPYKNHRPPKTCNLMHCVFRQLDAISYKVAGVEYGDHIVGEYFTILDSYLRHRTVNEDYHFMGNLTILECEQAKNDS